MPGGGMVRVDYGGWTYQVMFGPAAGDPPHSPDGTPHRSLLSQT
jgi:hypothetical protein